MTLGHQVARHTPLFGKYQPLIFFSSLFVHKLPPATMGFVKGGKQKQRDPYKVQGGNKKQRRDLRGAAVEIAAATKAEVPSETETEESMGKKPRAGACGMQIAKPWESTCCHRKSSAPTSLLRTSNASKNQMNRVGVKLRRLLVRRLD